MKRDWREYRLGNMVGATSAMVELFEQIRAAAAGDEPVLVYGEPGTGKHRVVENLCRLRGKEKIKKILAQELETIDVSSECIYDGEIDGVTGLEHIHGQVLRVEDPDDCKSQLWKLIQIYESKSFVREGKSFPVDFQLVLSLRVGELSFLNTEVCYPVKHVEQDSFGNELFSFVITEESANFMRDIKHKLWCPPLRERKDDFELLVNHFCDEEHKAWNLEEFADYFKADEKCIEFLIDNQYPWPGKLREFRERLRFACVFGKEYGWTLKEELERYWGMLASIESRKQIK